ncbi:MAG TPA: hypothetical protein VN192_03450 [Flavobacterium sp.]|jgi:uncharacterized protein YjeT (DUF2065 family)|nr:hypothetical protein [Flavobacterium sp.]
MEELNSRHLLYGIVSILFGVVILFYLYRTIRAEKKKYKTSLYEKSLNIKGYFAGIAFIAIGLVVIYRELIQLF